MKNLFCFLLTLCLYNTNQCVNKYIYTVFNEDNRLEWQITKQDDGSWHFVEFKHDLNSGSSVIVNEGQANDDRVQFITNMVERLSVHPEIKFQNIIQLLDQETIANIKNKEFFLLADTDLMYVLTLLYNQDSIQVILRKATPEERNIYIKIKAFEYAINKKTLSAHQQNA